MLLYVVLTLILIVSWEFYYCAVVSVFMAERWYVLLHFLVMLWQRAGFYLCPCVRRAGLQRAKRRWLWFYWPAPGDASTHHSTAATSATGISSASSHQSPLVGSTRHLFILFYPDVLQPSICWQHKPSCLTTKAVLRRIHLGLYCNGCLTLCSKGQQKVFFM